MIMDMSTDTAYADVVNDQIGTTLRALVAINRMRMTDVTAILGVSRSAIYERLSLETKWSAAEVKTLADYFEVPVSQFFDGIPNVRPISSAPSKARFRCTEPYAAVSLIPVHSIAA